jgi:hypothetical protein
MRRNGYFPAAINEGDMPDVTDETLRRELEQRPRDRRGL